MSASEPIGHGLNPAQKEAVLYLDGPCLVLAGAGSGKTRVITQKIAYLLRECGYMGRNVVALTFTNKAAREMDERVKTLVDRKLSKGLTISTFHSLGVKMLREEARNAGPQADLLDPGRGRCHEHHPGTAGHHRQAARLRHVQGIISLWKNALMEPDDAAQAAQTPAEAEAANVYRSYAATLAAYQAVDFDDLIRIPALLLAGNEEVRTRWQNRVRYLLVDEYQDTNVCQYRLVQLLTGQRAMFTAVGDDDQAIYAWRGATIENLAKLTTDYPNIKLHQAGAELPLGAAHPGGGQQRHRAQSRCSRKTVVRPGHGRAHRRVRHGRRGAGGRVHRDESVGRALRAPGAVEGLRHPLPQQPPVAHPGTGAAQPEDPVHHRRRAEFL